MLLLSVNFNMDVAPPLYSEYPPPLSVHVCRYNIPTFWNTLEPDPSRFGEVDLSWEEGGDVARARFLFECGILPGAGSDFMNFCQYWGRFMSA